VQKSNYKKIKKSDRAQLTSQTLASSMCKVHN